MRRPNLTVLLLALAFVAAACSGSSDSAADTADDQAESTAPADAESDTEESAADSENDTEANSTDEAPASDTPVEGFDYGTIDYDAESGESALRGDRTHPSFPPPVVELTQILSGGPPPDGIFPIDEPNFAPAEEIDYPIADNEPVVAVEIDGDARAFPVQLMIWHEIVNTEIGNVPVSVTYCPLCNSALTFDRRLGDRVLDFGTSGELYQSALVMYDRQTESLWSHFIGTGLVGHYAGAELELIPTQTVSYQQWRDANPDGLVLTRELNAPPEYQDRYGSNPYVGYDVEAVDPSSRFFLGEIDRTLLAKARIVGITDDDGSVAVRFEDLFETPVIPVTEGGRNLVVFFQPGLASALDSFLIEDGREVGQSGVFVPVAADGTALTFTAEGDLFVDAETGSTWNILGRAVDGPLAGEQLESAVHTDTFWFAWASYRPDTVIVEPV